MKVGTPFKCNNCGAQLTWRDTPVIECDYCHTRILMKDVVKPPTGKKPNVAMFVVGAALVGGVGIIVARAGRSSSSSTTTSSSVTVTTSSSTTVTTSSSAQPPAPAAPAKPAEPPGIAKKVLAFGEEGTGAGQLSHAMALAVTPAGDIVVAETGTGRVHVFDGTGTYQRVITLPGSTTTKELSVFGAGATPDNKVVVSRSGDLVWLDVATATVAKTLPANYPDIWFHGDVDVAPDGTVWATMDRTGDLSVAQVSAAGKLIKQHKKVQAEHVAIDGVGTLFVTRPFDPVVEVRDSKLEIARKFSQTTPGKKLDRPEAVALDGKAHVFVGDGHKIHVFDPEGGYLGTIESGSVNDLAVDSKGALYVLSNNTHVDKYELALPAK